MTGRLLSYFKSFQRAHPFFETDEIVEFFSIYGGVECQEALDPFKLLEESIMSSFCDNFQTSESFISPSYLLDKPYLSILKAVAKSDGKISNTIKHSRLGDKKAGELIAHLVDLGVLFLEQSRQAPIRTSSQKQIKKSLRGYKIEPKVRFNKPFFRFWFTFVERCREELVDGNSKNFIENFHKHKDKAFSIIFEQLSSEWLCEKYSMVDPIVSSGGFWDHKSEFDILHITKSSKIILGECKFKSKKVTAAELSKLKHKALDSGINADKYILFSKSGFSNELLSLDDESVILYDMDNFVNL